MDVVGTRAEKGEEDIGKAKKKWFAISLFTHTFHRLRKVGASRVSLRGVHKFLPKPCHSFKWIRITSIYFLILMPFILLTISIKKINCSIKFNILRNTILNTLYLKSLDSMLAFMCVIHMFLLST